MMFRRPLRFCMITTFYPPYHFGGDAIFVHRLSNELAQRGHRVQVIHSIDAYRVLGGREPTERFESHPSIEIDGLRNRWSFLSPLCTYMTGAPLLVKKHIQEVLARGFDVIHYHNVSLVGGPAILRYGRAIKLYTPHEYWLVCPTHMLLRSGRETCKGGNCVACTVAHGRPPQLWRYSGMVSDALAHVDAFLGLARFSESIHRSRGLDLPFHFLPSFLPAPDGHAGGPLVTASVKPYFLYVGRLEELKGVETLIPVFRQYQDVELWIVGAGKTGSHLGELARSCPNIRFLGHKSYEELHSIYRGATAVIIPSLFFEISPLVAIEAASHGVPIIARDLGGLGEIVRESGGGILYKTEQELVAAIDALRFNASLRRELGYKGAMAAQQQWSAAAHMERYLGLIAEIAERRGIALQ